MFSVALAISTVISTPLILLVIGLLFAIMLTIADQRLKIEVDPKVAAVREILPGANCGGCGFASCDQFAEALAEGKVEPGGCVVVGAAAKAALAEVLGVEVRAEAPKKAIIHCGARGGDRHGLAEYSGAMSCTEANLVAGVMGCAYGCLGLGECRRVCPFDAIEMVAGLPVVSIERCTGCGQCVAACPRGIITLEPLLDDPLVVNACSSRDTGKVVRENCEVGCIACGICAKLDPKAFKVEGNLCAVLYDRETYGRSADHDAPVGKCPTFCLRQVGVAIGEPYAQVEARRREKAEKAAQAKAAATAKSAAGTAASRAEQ
jgi:electron transport complex protein RnfB